MSMEKKMGHRNKGKSNNTGKEIYIYRFFSKEVSYFATERLFANNQRQAPIIGK